MIVAHTKCNRRDVNRLTYIVENREKHKDALTKKGNNFIVVKLTFNIARRTKTGWEKPHIPIETLDILMNVTLMQRILTLVVHQQFEPSCLVPPFVMRYKILDLATGNVFIGRIPSGTQSYPRNLRCKATLKDAMG